MLGLIDPPTVGPASWAPRAYDDGVTFSSLIVIACALRLAHTHHLSHARHCQQVREVEASNSQTATRREGAGLDVVTLTRRARSRFPTTGTSSSHITTDDASCEPRQNRRSVSSTRAQMCRSALVAVAIRRTLGARVLCSDRCAISADLCAPREPRSRCTQLGHAGQVLCNPLRAAAGGQEAVSADSAFWGRRRVRRRNQPRHVAVRCDLGTGRESRVPCP